MTGQGSDQPSFRIFQAPLGSNTIVQRPAMQRDMGLLIDRGGYKIHCKLASTLFALLFYSRVPNKRGAS